MIEEERAVEKIDEIAATPGADVIFIGTSDLSFSMGYRGQSDHPRVQEAVKRVLAAGKANHKAVGLPLKSSEQIKQRATKGSSGFKPRPNSI